jgi:hypothetical protein
MADGTLTITIDTASSPWVMQNGESTTVTGQAQLFTMLLTDLGTTANYTGGSTKALNTVALANGSHLQFSGCKNMVYIGPGMTDTTAKVNPGSFWVSEDDGPEVEVKITTMTVSDADCSGGGGTVANGLTTATFEYPGKPWQWTWANQQMVLV